jgi:DNA-binding NtrC family response regulator
VLGDLKRRLAQLAQVGTPLMLRGERGMQAEMFVRHLLSAGAPFVSGDEALNDPPSEILARAAGGILFVADLSRLTRSEQKNLEFLLVRAERHKARVVSFSAVEPQRLVAEHDFDADLMVRLSELVIALPALRDFAEEIPDIAALVLAQLVEARACPPRRFSIAALNALRHHQWSGNLAQLDAVVKNLGLTALDEEVRLEDVERVLAAHSGPVAAGELPLDQPYRDARDAFERLYFEYQLARENGSMSKVADRTGLERTHLYRKLKALGLPVGRREET